MKRDVYDRYRECLLKWDTDQDNHLGIGDGFGITCKSVNYSEYTPSNTTATTVRDGDAADCDMDTAEEGSDNSKTATEAFDTPPHDADVEVDGEGDGEGDAREEMAID